MFPHTDPKQSFPALENEVIKYWRENRTFERSLEIRKDAPEYVFYDGPPFATGTPHYGHILAGVIKDVIPRYWTMRGKYVERRFGWDCHGLPIENIVEKKLGISGKKDIEEKLGVFAFNEECRKNVFGYVDEWRKVVERTGRWVDMDNDYKTLDRDFMESVWWVFKSVYDKGLIYESHRVVPYCPRCSTPLSNFEVNQGYEDKQDKAVTVKFKVKDSASKYVLAWTTTPWTLPANLGLAVGTEIAYAEIRDHASGDTYVLAKDRVATYYKNPEDYTLVREYPGSCLVGLEYEPLFNEPREKSELGELPKGQELGRNAYRVVSGHHVTTESGTGVVHIAPAYGEDDFQIGAKEGLGFFSHINATGNVEGLGFGEGEYVFDFNETVIKYLKDTKSLVHIGSIDHSYPHCYRCKTPLIYRAVSAWYVSVEKIKDGMLKSNEGINWTPEHIKEGRFGKWLEGARDWNISRNRYWGSAIPVWKSEDGEVIVVGSVKELAELSRGQIVEKDGDYVFADTKKPVDIHKHFVDKITIEKNGKTFTRIPEVLDCWFESGSMPYAQKHYPFENKERFEKAFPADFICEGLDQTRGWFYTLVVLSAALYGHEPFKNVIVNGIILAEDGKKMSKSLSNYPDPMLLLEKHGADAVRFFLMNSPAVRAEELRFSEGGVEETVKKVILPIWNSLSFFTTYANIDGYEPEGTQIHFVRHGQTDANLHGRLSDGFENSPLNATGKEQALAAGRELFERGAKFDLIVASPLERASETASIIAAEVGYPHAEIVYDDALVERKSGKYSGKFHSDIVEEHFRLTGERIEIRHSSKIWANDESAETIPDYVERHRLWHADLVERHKGKKILVVAHGGTFRAFNQVLRDLDHEEAFRGVRGLHNCEIAELPVRVLGNPLDKFILGELQTLIARVNDSFEAYDLQKGARAIVDFLDDLTNWYVRRSRRRFWENGMTDDKKNAYDTLRHVLVETSKVLAPFAPFVSEHVFRVLTGKESVHLERFPSFNPTAVSTELLSNMKKAKDLVALGLAARSKAKIRVRQPLFKVVVGESLPQYYLDIVRDELNVKEVAVEDMSKIAKKVVKPNARLIGPKFGKDVQAVILAAKSGEFEELEGGKIAVGEFVLESGEFEVEYVPLLGSDSGFAVEGGYGTVVALDAVVTDELRIEGVARDLIRVIQDSRKEAGYSVSDRIRLSLLGEGVGSVLAAHSDYLESETLADIVAELPDPDVEKTIETDMSVIVMRVKKT
jgi:isoleucyl-tRNA synthetase